MEHSADIFLLVEPTRPSNAIGEYYSDVNIDASESTRCFTRQILHESIGRILFSVSVVLHDNFTRQQNINCRNLF
jgi:hypothetical protein